MTHSLADRPTAESLLDGLNQEQQEAVITTEGPVLVVAGPGSGKTRVLTHRIAFLLEVKGVAPERVLAVTFTNKAAREMRNRIERLLGGRSLTGLEMGTFHSFGARLLRRNPGLAADRLSLMPNFLIYDDADQIDLARKAVVAVNLDPKNLPPRRVLSRISQAKSMLLSPAEVIDAAASYDDEVIGRVYNEYQRLLRKANAVDFDDLLGLPIRLLDQAPSLLDHYQEQYQYILVDEYQDTNRVQYVLISALATKHRNLFVVGDPDQSIYAWRQADIRNILDFEKEFPDSKQIHLELNYRSTRRIVEIADRVIRENTQRIDRRLRTDNDDGPLVSVRELSDQGHEARHIVDEIRRLMTVERLSGDGIAVMYRTTTQSRVLEEAFRTSDIPYRIIGGVRFYDRKEVKDVLAVLRLLHNPHDEVSLERVIDNTTLGRGIGPKALDTMRAWATVHGEPLLGAFLAMAPTLNLERPAPALSGAARTSAQKLGTVFGRLRERHGLLPLTELFDLIVDETGYHAGFDENNDEEMERWANVLELRTDLEKYDVLAPGDALAAYLEQVALVSDVDTMEDDGRGRVTLITLHSAKGLEYPAVFIAGVEEGLLPIRRAVEAEFTDPQPLEEERRLFYVGITRAERLLFLTYTGVRALYGQYQSSVPSRFLANIPQSHLESHVRRSGSRGSTAASRQSLAGHLRGGTRPGGNVVPLFADRETAEPTPTVRYQTGQRVFHTKFGEGVITEVADRRGDQELAIAFIRHGTKRLMGSLAPLDVIE